jgi:hypothetical protein
VGHQVLTLYGGSYQCVCPSHNQFLIRSPSENHCRTCPENALVDSEDPTKCVCQGGYEMREDTCVCTGVVDEKTKACEGRSSCPANEKVFYNKNGGLECCPPKATFDIELAACVCDDPTSAVSGSEVGARGCKNCEDATLSTGKADGPSRCECESGYTFDHENWACILGQCPICNPDQLCDGNGGCYCSEDYCAGPGMEYGSLGTCVDKKGCECGSQLVWQTDADHPQCGCPANEISIHNKQGELRCCPGATGDGGTEFDTNLDACVCKNPAAAIAGSELGARGCKLCTYVEHGTGVPDGTSSCKCEEGYVFDHNNWKCVECSAPASSKDGVCQCPDESYTFKCLDGVCDCYPSCEAAGATDDGAGGCSCGDGQKYGCNAGRCKCIIACKDDEFPDMSAGKCRTICPAETPYYYPSGWSCVSDCPWNTHLNKESPICEDGCRDQLYADERDAICVDHCGGDGFFADPATMTCSADCSRKEDVRDLNSRMCTDSCRESIYPYADPASRYCVESCKGEEDTEYFLTDESQNRCVAQCPSGYFWKPGSETVCMQCEKMTVSNLDNTACVTDCDPVDDITYYTDFVYGGCVAACPSGSYAVSYDTRHGNGDEELMVARRRNICVESCEDTEYYEGLYAEPDSGFCVKDCPKDGRSWADLSTSMCVESCSAGTEPFDDGSDRLMCAVCSPGTASAGDGKLCHDCSDDDTFSNPARTECVPSCDEGYFADHETHACSELCSQVDGIQYFTDLLTRSCVATCPVPYYADASTGRCVQRCEVSNDAPFGDSATKMCTDMCTSGTFGQQSSNLCVAECDSGSYGDPTTQLCRASCPTGYTADAATHTCIVAAASGDGTSAATGASTLTPRGTSAQTPASTAAVTVTAVGTSAQTPASTAAVTVTAANTPAVSLTRGGTSAQTPASTAAVTVTAVGTSAQTPASTAAVTVSAANTPAVSLTRGGTSAQTPASTAAVTVTAVGTSAQTPASTAAVTVSAANTPAVSLTRGGTSAQTPASTAAVTVTAVGTSAQTPASTAAMTVTPAGTSAQTPASTAAVSVTSAGTSAQTPASTAAVTVTPSRTSAQTPASTAAVTVTPAGTSAQTPASTAAVSVTSAGTSAQTPASTAAVSVTSAGTSAQTPVSTAAVTVTPSRTSAQTPASTAAVTVTPSGTSAQTPASTAAASNTASPTSSRTSAATATMSVSASRTGTQTSTPSLSNTASVTASASVSPSGTPTYSFQFTHTQTTSTTPLPTEATAPSYNPTCFCCMPEMVIDSNTGGCGCLSGYTQVPEKGNAAYCTRTSIIVPPAVKPAVAYYPNSTTGVMAITDTTVIGVGNSIMQIAQVSDNVVNVQRCTIETGCIPSTAQKVATRLSLSALKTVLPVTQVVLGVEQQSLLAVFLNSTTNTLGLEMWPANTATVAVAAGASRQIESWLRNHVRILAPPGIVPVEMAKKGLTYMLIATRLQVALVCLSMSSSPMLIDYCPGHNATTSVLVAAENVPGILDSGVGSNARFASLADMTYAYIKGRHLVYATDAGAQSIHRFQLWIPTAATGNVFFAGDVITVLGTVSAARARVVNNLAASDVKLAGLRLVHVLSTGAFVWNQENTFYYFSSDTSTLTQAAYGSDAFARIVSIAVAETRMTPPIVMALTDSGTILKVGFAGPSPTPSVTPMPTATKSGTAAATQSRTSTRSPTNSMAATRSATMSRTNTRSGSATTTGTRTNTPTYTQSRSESKSATPSRAATPSRSGSALATPSATFGSSWVATPTPSRAAGDADSRLAAMAFAAKAPGYMHRVAVGVTHACAIKKIDDFAVGGPAVCWGTSKYGEADAPNTNFVTVAVTEKYSCGLSPYGYLDCWGAVPSRYYSLSRSQVYLDFSVGGDGACGITSEGSLICIGEA